MILNILCLVVVVSCWVVTMLAIGKERRRGDHYRALWESTFAAHNVLHEENFNLRHRIARNAEARERVSVN